MNYTEPHIPVPEDVIPKMLELASVKPGEVVYDLGSGDGRILIAASRDFHATAVGVEVRKRLVKQGRERAKELGLSRQVKVLNANFKKVSLRKADVLAIYLSSYTLNLLVPKFTRELRPGTRIVNFDYPILGWKPAREIKILPAGWKKSHPIYLYVV
jgi:ubiquinone/menaquinone biosynthesis C-methylase UbiE